MLGQNKQLNLNLNTKSELMCERLVHRAEKQLCIFMELSD